MKYFRQLDGLRCVAVSLVLLAHFAVITDRYLEVGFYGVDMFFALSGFLITNILVSSSEPFGQAYKKFIGRRTLRIFPIYYLTLFILFALGNPYAHTYIGYCLSYTFNYAMAYFHIPDNLLSHLWSLSVEEQFYLFWPFLILALRSRLNILKYVIVLLILFCGIQQQFEIIHVLALTGRGLIPNAYALGIGALGAVFYKERKIPTALLENKWVEYFAVASFFLLMPARFEFKFFLVPVLTLYLVFKSTQTGFLLSAVNRFLNNKRIVYLGTISYGIYLYHLPLEHYLTTYAFDPIWENINWASLGRWQKLQWNSWIIKLPVYSLIAIGVAAISFKYLERPLLSLKDKWFKPQVKSDRFEKVYETTRA